MRYSSILFPTDFSPGSVTAFAHALRLAIRHKARLTLLHAGGRKGEPDWHQFPGVREMLERWKLLEPGARRSAVLSELGVQVEKVSIRGRSVVDGILAYMADHLTDMLVLATAGREGLDRFVQGSVAEPLSRHAAVTTLFVPNGARGCVAESDGTVTLDRILVPVARDPAPEAAVDAAMNAVDGYGGLASPAITLLHVGGADGAPELELPAGDRWTFEYETRPGDVAHEIVMAADDYGANLVVMVTEGRRGFMDALTGSTTERVIRRSPCPVLAVPAETP
jgi:nucleotide-binding universal stress UspA family protein